MGLDSTGSSPVFPTFYMRYDYVYFVNHLKLNTAKKKYFFEVRVTPQIYPLLQVFHELQIIRRFTRLNGTQYRIFLAWKSHTSPYRMIKVYAHAKNPIVITWKALSVLTSRLGHSSLILRTSRGIITHQTALRLRLGGHLLCLVH